MLLHALGDTIGFKNGDWEFNYGKLTNLSIVNELLYEFIELGGINHLDIKGWKISDDTMLHLATAHSFVTHNDFDKIIDTMIKNFILAFRDMKGRRAGISTEYAVKKLASGQKWTDMKYDFSSGGSGAAMRTLCLGLIFNGKSNRNQLIKYAIESSRLTHNSATGYLGGLTAALFTSYALEQIPIEEWPYKLISLIEFDKLNTFFINSRGFEEYDRDKHIFISKWKQYIDDKFDDKHKVKEKIGNLIQRSRYYLNYKDDDRRKFPGSSGDDSVIIAYDCLIDSGPNWEKLIIYAMLHYGDTDTTGAIAGGWYGALYGFTDVPVNLIKNIEKVDDVLDIANKLYKKYGTDK